VDALVRATDNFKQLPKVSDDIKEVSPCSQCLEKERTIADLSVHAKQQKKQQTSYLGIAIGGGVLAMVCLLFLKQR